MKVKAKRKEEGKRNTRGEYKGQEKDGKRESKGKKVGGGS